VVLGGPNTITPEVEATLQSYAATVTRWAGPDRFSTSAAITRLSYDPGVGTVYIASGRVFSDALSGAPVAGMTAGPVLLTDTTTLPESVALELARLAPRRIVVLGGPRTLSYAVQARLSNFVTPSVPHSVLTLAFGRESPIRRWDSRPNARVVAEGGSQRLFVHRLNPPDHAVHSFGQGYVARSPGL